MKKFYLFFVCFVIAFSVKAAAETIDYRRAYGDAFIFVEDGVEFAVYPDGQFDFFYNQRRTGYNVNVVSPSLHVTYNSGYNYDPYIQVDDFGAVIQIEHVPVFYDYYGRIIQAGNVRLSYNQFGMLARVGNLFLHYDYHNHFSHYSGYINRQNPFYVYKPWHRHYTRPRSHFAVVYTQPYRAYYQPNRMKYRHYRNYYKKHHNDNFRKQYYRPGERVTSYHRGRRSAAQRDLRNHNRLSDSHTGTTRSNRNSSRDQKKMQARRVQQVNSVSNRQADVRKRENFNSQNRSSSREHVANSRLARVEKNTASKEQVRKVTHYDSKRSSVNNRTETRVENSGVRSSSRASVVRPKATKISPSQNSRSSRGRGNG